jgi:ABC-type bacteriocin/lantibiotic exporter with double-glycine peptidase domain
VSFIDNLNKLFKIFDIGIVAILPLIALFIFSGIIDLVGISLIAPYISLLIEGEANFFFQKFEIFSFLNPSNQEKLITFLSYGLLIIFVFKFIFSLLIRFLILKFSFNCRRKLQMKLLKSYQNMEYNNYNLKGSSEFIKNVRELSGDCTSCLDSGLRVLSELIVLISILIYLILINPTTVVVLITILMLVMLLHNYILKPKTIKYGEEKIKALDFIYQAVNEGLSGFKEVKILNKEKYFQKILEKGTRGVFINDLKSSIILFYPRYLFEVLIVAFIISYVILSINSGVVGTNLLPIIGIFAVASVRVIPSISIIANGLIMVNYTYFAIKVIFDDLFSFEKEKINNLISTQDNEKKVVKSIELKNIKFSYKKTKENIFENLNLIIEENDCIGITGENGSGKTTLVDILLGLLNPSSGTIYINGLEQKNIIKPKFMGYLPQDHLIISDKISNNITLENLDENINRVKLDEAIQASNLQDLIKSLPNGVNSYLGKDGTKLSGGQYKKIALARLFYHNKEVLIMDEATNSLDDRSENIVIDELIRLKKEKTIIIISHKQKPLSICNKLYKIENKKLNLVN